jgi:recombination protein RecA
MAINLNKLINNLNKKMGTEIAYDLSKSDILKVKSWVKTGSTWLDHVICEGKVTGWPSGFMIELIGPPGTGKSFMALQAMINAQRQGYTPVLFAPERGWSMSFFEKAGLDLENFLYIQPHNVEEVFELIESILTEGEQFFIVWDSLASTPCKEDEDKGYDPKSSVAAKPKVISRGMEKLVGPFSDTNSIFLILNQPYQVFPKSKWDIPVNSFAIGSARFQRSGGNKLHHSLSLSVLLTRTPSSKGDIFNAQKELIGVSARLRILKSRFGSEGRKCEFGLLFGGGQVKVMDAESLVHAIHPCEWVIKAKGWFTLTMPDGKSFKYSENNFAKKYETDAEFRDAVLQTMNYQLVQKYANKDLTPVEHKDESGEESGKG